ncbi:MAG TPA: endonuclease domain-containing protein [Brevundimonas sp.]|uniref:endonuclease domain-containing protein n=1 Tax=Brevundimonas sp. TaxID=1871086 RepID=UPI002E0E4FB3|nr:endonuclease domain-containing protein [Brevundimonas sp.]
MRQQQSPFPPDGGRVGDGGASADLAGLHAGGESGIASCASLLDHRDGTPTQPSPIEGEGFARERTPGRTVRRARLLRSTPTWTEAKLWERLRRLPVRFRRQPAFGRFVPDFACHRAALVIEIDGGVHQRPEVALRDLERDQWFESQGYAVLRVSTGEVEADLDGLLIRIRALASSRIGKVI